MSYKVDVRGLEVFNDIGGWLDEDVTFVVDSRIAASETDVDVTVYTFPDLTELVDLIQRIDLSRTVAEDTAASDIV